MSKDTQLPAEEKKKKYNTQNLLNANEARKNTHQTFLDRIKVSESGCWEWQHTKDYRGYGQIRIDGVTWRSHRYSYQYYKGDIGNLNVLHKCDNPPCCNPDHLFLGNQSENAIDMIQKGRSRVAKTTPEMVFKIRDLFAAGLKRSQIMEIVGATRPVVESILRNKTWTHLTKSPIKYIAVNAEEYASLQQEIESLTNQLKKQSEVQIENMKLLRQENEGAHTLLEKVIYRHEGGLLPDRLLYNEIKTFLDGK